MVWCSGSLEPKTPHSMASANLLVLDLEMDLGGCEDFWMLFVIICRASTNCGDLIFTDINVC